MNASLLLKSVRPMAGATVDLLISNGKITQIGDSIEAPDGETTVIAGGGLIAVPGFVDAHTHIDKTLLGFPWQPHSAGPTIREKIDNERRLLGTLELDSREQSEKQVRLALSKGTTHIRTHTDVNAEKGLVHLE
ncbi:MAG: cytosine deaminase, partial [Rhodospirillales bacterium]|nr:cytosine deaminase [Rhodospirillales bacterium]